MDHLRLYTRLSTLFIIGLLWSNSVFGVDPDCVAPGVLASPAMWQDYCTNNPTATCDLGMTAWNPLTYSSPDIRVGDSYSAAGERPRFFYDSVGDFYYTKIYSQLYNLQSGPAASSEVSIVFSVTTDVAAALVDPTHFSVTWQTIGTYQAHVPAAPHVIFPGPAPHQQFNAVCWDQPPDTLFPDRFIIRAALSWAEDGNNVNDTIYSLYDLRALGQPSQIALALDLSGSMDALTSTGFSRLVEAKERARNFVDLVEDGHQLGVYGFATGNTANSSFVASYKDALNVSHSRTLNETSEISAIQTLGPTTNRNAIRTAISAQNSHDCTPVGQALLRARKEIDDSLFPEAGTATPSKAIVLFSDGLQNVPPFVNASSWTCHSGTAGPIISTARTFADEDFTIYSVYFGDEVGWGYSLMNDIKQQTGGDYIYGVDNGIDLSIAYYAIRGLVDDMIYLDEEGVVSSSQPSASFTVPFDSAASQATVTIGWPYDQGTTQLIVEHRQQGQTEWVPLQDQGQGDTTTANTSPYRVYRFIPGANTTWEFRVRQLLPQRGSTTYVAAVFSEVETLQMFPSLDDDTITAGDPLTIHADLLSLGHPVLGAQVSAVVEVPTRSFSTTLRSYADRFNVKPTPDANKVMGMAKQLKQFLLKDVGSDALYLFKNVAVTLRDDGQAPDKTANDGVYSGELPASETRVAGRYEVTIKARGALPSGKSGERITKLSTIANVAPADPDRSIVKIGPFDPRGDGTSVAMVSIQPTDRFGNAAFPGSGAGIQVTTNGKPAVGLVDNLDTTFTQQISVPTGQPVKVAVAVGGVMVEEEQVGPPGDVGRGHEFSLHAGGAIPHGAFAKTFDGGPALGLDYALRYDRHFAVRAELDFNWFDEKAGDTQILSHLDVYLQYRRPLANRWTPYFEGGIGVYDLENRGNGVGFAVGIGTYYRLNNRWDLDITMRGHRVGGKLDLSFSQILAGAVYKF